MSTEIEELKKLVQELQLKITDMEKPKKATMKRPAVSGDVFERWFVTECYEKHKLFSQGLINEDLHEEEEERLVKLIAKGSIVDEKHKLYEEFINSDFYKSRLPK